MRIRTSAMAAGFALVALASSAAGEATGIVVRSEPAPGSDTPRVVMTATIDAPPEKVWAIVSDCAHYKERMPRIAASRLLAKAGSTYTCEVTVEMPFPLSNLTAVTEAVHTESADRYVRRWKLLRGDYKVNDGSWEVRPADASRARSLVTYTVHAEPNTPVPGWVREKAQKKALPEMIERVAAEA
ncbi:MAG TPA: SRPBCC family protein, partial [Minicystis sp.]|nr:SRPBCC family protein [Minicystis sp.]